MTGRRLHERYSRSIPVSVTYEDKDYEALTENLSVGGMYLVTKAPVPYGADIRIRFRIPNLKDDTVCIVTVRWIKEDGIGVRFGSLRAIEVWGLNQLLKPPQEG